MLMTFVSVHVIKIGPIKKRICSVTVCYKRRINKFVGSNLLNAHTKFSWINYIDISIPG